MPRHADLDDAALLRRATRQDDPAAFAVLYDRHAAAALGAARRIVGSPAAAEDVVQDAFVQLWRSAERFAPDRGSVRAWLLVLVRSRALDALRRERVRTGTAERVLATVDGAAVLAPSAAEEAEARARVRDVRAGLDALPPEQGEALGRVLLAGHTHREVARDLDVPLGTVKGRTRLGLVKLRRTLHAHAAG